VRMGMDNLFNLNVGDVEKLREKRDAIGLIQVLQSKSL